MYIINILKKNKKYIKIIIIIAIGGVDVSLRASCMNVTQLNIKLQ